MSPQATPGGDWLGGDWLGGDWLGGDWLGGAMPTKRSPYVPQPEKCSPYQRCATSAHATQTGVDAGATP